VKEPSNCFPLLNSGNNMYHTVVVSSTISYKFKIQSSRIVIPQGNVSVHCSMERVSDDEYYYNFFLLESNQRYSAGFQECVLHRAFGSHFHCSHLMIPPSFIP